MKLKIYVCYSSPTHLVGEGSVLTPIQVGRAASPLTLPMIGDDTGDNISARNAYYCELTGQYWAWKQDRDATHIGCMHYRRFLDFRPEVEREVTRFRGVVEPAFFDDFYQKYGLTDEQMTAMAGRYDVIVPEPLDYSGTRIRSTEHEYRTARHHNSWDFDTTRRIMAELYPDDMPYFEQMAARRFFHPTNIFVMRRDVFDEYCAWLFPLLDGIYAATDLSAYDEIKRRVIGYIAERLFNVFLLKKTHREPGLRIKVLRTVFVEDSSRWPAPPSLPDTVLPTVTLTTAIDAGYLPHAGAMLVSVLTNASHGHFIDVIILDGGLATHERLQLQALTRLHPHCDIRFVAMTEKFRQAKVHGYLSRATFFRLALPLVLPRHDKVLYLDADMIVLGDVSSLFTVDLQGNLVAAARDIHIESLRRRGEYLKKMSTEITLEGYVQENLGLASGKQPYFQAGTLLLDLRALRKAGLAEAMIRDALSCHYWFQDQDVINKHLAGRVRELELKWNLIAIPDPVEARLLETYLSDYTRSLDNPGIIHFAGADKPWLNSRQPLAHYYWLYLRQTPWYEKVLLDCLHSSAKPASGSRAQRDQRVGHVLAFWWKRLPVPIRKAVMPVARRVAVKLGRVQA